MTLLWLNQMMRTVVLMVARSPASDLYHALPSLVWLISLRPSHAWIFVLLCLDLAVLGDVVTGTKLWFGPSYLLVMCLAAWCLGWRAALVTSSICLALTFAVNGVALYPNGDVDLLRNFIARLIAIAVVLAIVAGSRRAYLREWWLARTDPLTGAFNRQAFFELSEGLARSQAWRVLLYADLDGLKRVNDEQGHSAGDLVLKNYAKVVRRNIREADLFARVGGDEFLIFMSIKDQAAGVAVGKRLHEQMNCVPLQQGGFSRCSLGVLIISPGAREIDSLVRRADALMYRAKLRGASLALETVEDDFAAVHAGGNRMEPRTTFSRRDVKNRVTLERRSLAGTVLQYLAGFLPLRVMAERTLHPGTQRKRRTEDGFHGDQLCEEQTARPTSPVIGTAPN